MRTYVIGDIHGCFQEFVELLDLCGAHAASKPARLITLGDYVDRGPDSFRVVRLIRHRLRRLYPGFASVINLKGNHELMMAEAALGGERGAKQSWVSPDGCRTISSGKILVMISVRSTTPNTALMLATAWDRSSLSNLSMRQIS